jgi:cyclopropane fatty-acyl-phospholipid synthase-like methyltransferase
MDTFGQEQLKKGSGVLDIAGGKGELSFELLNLNGIQATVVEPRALQLWRQHKWMLVSSQSLSI